MAKASIFSRNAQEHVFNQGFTITSLAFLCSRVLTASKRGIAAMTILSAFRLWKSRQRTREKRILSKLACDCQSVYRTRNRVVHAALILQREWRLYLAQKEGGTTFDQRRDTAKWLADMTDRERKPRFFNHTDIWMSGGSGVL